MPPPIFLLYLLYTLLIYQFVMYIPNCHSMRNSIVYTEYRPVRRAYNVVVYAKFWTYMYEHVYTWYEHVCTLYIHGTYTYLSLQNMIQLCRGPTTARLCPLIRFVRISQLLILQALTTPPCQFGWQPLCHFGWKMVKKITIFWARTTLILILPCRRGKREITPYSISVLATKTCWDNLYENGLAWYVPCTYWVHTCSYMYVQNFAYTTTL